MSRPNIVRADTIDLQDQDNPTAAEHQKHPNQARLAPHQAAEVHHVLEERHSEEQALSDAWNISGTGEPGAIDDAQANGNREQGTNGASHEGENGGEGGESEGDGDDDMMDRISSSPSIDDEDIDFEFVYALHTFVATVEGQANATKGDTMVLLDDSNSYWWLVRVVKDSSIGYLPAEHIETPTERLARLNKHRNIDLSATMLSDNSEKSRNPMKNIIRRRNAKTVQFAAPTYVEASDYDFSEDDEEHAMIEPAVAAAPAEEPQQAVQQAAPDTNGEKHDEEERPGTPPRGSFEREQAATAAVAPLVDEPQLSPRLVDKTEAAPLKSRKGTPRNTDSFLKDDSIETRKITLTPGLLREDSTSSKSPSSESVRNNSTENLVKQISPPEPQPPSKKDGKDKKKEKQKGGMLSGLFKSKKKDKKAKEEAAAESDADKASIELQRESPRASPMPSGSNSPVEKPIVAPSPVAQSPQAPQDARLQVPLRQAPSKGKLQKAPPSNGSSPVREPPSEGGKAFVAELAGSDVAFEMPTGDESVSSGQPQSIDVGAAQQTREREGPLSPIVNVFKTNSEKEPKPTKAKRTKQRMELDDFDSPADEDGPNPFKERELRSRGENGERLSESPVEITSGSFMHGTESIHIPTPGVDDREDEDEEPESLTSSPSIIEHPAEPHEHRDNEPLEDNDPTPTAPRSPQPGGETRNVSGSTPSTDSMDSSLLTPSPIPAPTWSDSSLRAWYDDMSEVKDMLTMIHDKSGVTPVSADHPMMAGLFVEERKGVQNMMGELDGLLGSYLQRKGISF